MAQQAAQAAPVSAYEKAIIFGDVSGLSERERLEYLKELAAEVGLNPITRPFGYLPAGDALTVYLTATGAAQLRRIHSVSVTEILDEGIVNGFYRVKVYGKMPNGRVDVECGSVPVTYRKTTQYHRAGDLLEPQELENARKKCYTQAKTRLTKSMVGLSGVLAEEELDDLAGEQGEQDQPLQLRAGQRQADTSTGEVAAPPTPAQLAEIHELQRLHNVLIPTAWEEVRTYREAEGRLEHLRKRLAMKVTAKSFTLALQAGQALEDAGGTPETPPGDGADARTVAAYIASCRAAQEALTEPEQSPI